MAKDKAIHEQIEARRVKLGISKYKLWQETNYSEQMLGKFLKGEHNPRIDKVEDIIKSLGGKLTIVWETTAPNPNKKK